MTLPGARCEKCEKLRSRPRVFVTRRLIGDGVARLTQEAAAEVWPGDDPPPRDVLLAEAQRSDGILTNIADRVDAGLIEAAPGLRIVSQMAVGYDNIDVGAATRQGVLVTNTPGVLVTSTPCALAAATSMLS